MPEGDTLHRIADALQVMVQQEVRSLSLPRQGLGHSVRGNTVTSVSAVGKNLLMFFSGGLVLHTHLKMTGLWHVYGPAERWRRAAQLAVAVVDTGNAVGVCFQAPLCRLVERRLIERELMPLTRIDLIATSCDLTEVITRLRTLPDTTAIGIALLDQQCVGGIGNVYKSEGLFRAKLSPLTPIATVADVQLHSLLADLQQVMRDNVGGFGNDATASAVRHYGYTRTTTTGCEVGKGPIAVYGRKGLPCFSCAAPIERIRQGPLQRSSYFCPRCQA